MVYKGGLGSEKWTNCFYLKSQTKRPWSSPFPSQSVVHQSAPFLFSTIELLELSCAFRTFSMEHDHKITRLIHVAWDGHRPYDYGSSIPFVERYLLSKKKKICYLQIFLMCHWLYYDPLLLKSQRLQNSTIFFLQKKVLKTFTIKRSLIFNEVMLTHSTSLMHAWLSMKQLQNLLQSLGAASSPADFTEVIISVITLQINKQGSFVLTPLASKL